MPGVGGHVRRSRPLENGLILLGVHSRVGIVHTNELHYDYKLDQTFQFLI